MASCFCFPFLPSRRPAENVHQAIPSTEPQVVAPTLLSTRLSGEKLPRVVDTKSCEADKVDEHSLESGTDADLGKQLKRMMQTLEIDMRWFKSFEADVVDVDECVWEDAEALSIFEEALYMTVGSVSPDGSQPWASPVPFWLTPIGPSIGICFATSSTSQTALNLTHGGHSTCSLSIFDAKAPLNANRGIQGTATVTALSRDEWTRGLQGLHARFPNFEGDVAQVHEQMISAMGYILIEVVVEQWFASSAVPVTMHYESAHMAPLSFFHIESAPGIENVTQLGQIQDASEKLSKIASSILGHASQLAVASVSVDGMVPWTCSAHFWLVPVGCSLGICFAAPRESPEVANLIHESGRTRCSLSILDSNTLFLTCTGLQAYATAALVPRERWPQALQGLRTRFPNSRADVVQEHEDLFSASNHILIEVVVDQWFMSLFTTTQFDHPVDVDVDLETVHLTPLSTKEAL